MTQIVQIFANIYGNHNEQRYLSSILILTPTWIVDVHPIPWV